MGTGFKHTVAADLLALALIGVPVGAAADDVTSLRVVVHVVDHASVPRFLMIGSQKMVAKVYAQAGVTMTFEEGYLPATSEPGVLDLQVSFLSEAMTEEKCRIDGLSDQIYGTAVRAARRAYVFYKRAIDQQSNGSFPGVVLAAVVAHEIGHLLLPEHSHSAEGLMRAKWGGVIRMVPPLSRVQATQIRETLRPVEAMATR